MLISIGGFAATAAAALAAAPLTVPFDFSRGVIGVDVEIAGVPLYMIVDTGVDPSVIDLARATALRLKVNRGDGGEADGFGHGREGLYSPPK